MEEELPIIHPLVIMEASTRIKEAVNRSWVLSSILSNGGTCTNKALVPCSDAWWSDR
jgi:hypothetical protein